MNNKLKIFNDSDGSLIPIEFDNISFIPMRMFVINDVPKGFIRGNHAHYETEQILICVKGEILVGLDDGKNKTETLLLPGDTIYINKMIWGYQKFLTGNEILISACSTKYDPMDYINDIEYFYKIASQF
jgi:dTDP-4-dehydrorhamnose 3,5-epimerase-like enzyme